ncbi:MAG: methyltransferase domain-containing protein [Chlamydiota bacterium]
MRKSSPPQHIWPAEEYHKHSSVQREAAMQILEYIKLNGDEQILDIGCGDGKITALVASRVPTGSVLGVDLSPEMINFAKNAFPENDYSNLRFSHQDVQQLNYIEKFDILFSSFALQWISNHCLFFKGAYKSLKPSGHLVATIPLGISSALEQSISELVSLPEWKPYFDKFSPGWNFISDIEFEQLLARHSFVPIRFTIVPHDVIFSSRKTFEEYVTPWFAYLCALPEHLKNVFFEQVIDRYLEIEPILSDEKVIFKFLRLEIIAIKATL